VTLPVVALVNGALGGRDGNTGRLARALTTLLEGRATVIEHHLAEIGPGVDWALRLKGVHGFIFSSGTYWDSWSSLFQRFLEEVTPLEGTPLLLGQPACCLITMHSVGGKEVLSRLQGVLVTLGMQIPPMSGLVYALSTALADEAGRHRWQDDFWSPSDLPILAHNLLEAMPGGERRWASWAVDRGDPAAVWFDGQGR
jgi:hypothetical protein